MSFDILSIAAGGILGASLASLNRWWQYRRENWYSRVIDFCKLADTAADTASSYWLDEVELSLLANIDSKKLKHARGRLEKYECSLIGIQAQLDGLHASFSYRLSFRDRPKVKTLLQDLGDTLTGGQFQGKDRRADPVRARVAHVLASDLIVEVRHALDRAIKLRGLFEYAIQHPHLPK